MAGNDRTPRPPATGGAPSTTSEAASWTCGGCGVTATFRADAPESGQGPAGWLVSADDTRCLACRRQEVIERAAAEAGPSDGRHRRRLLTEFELLRDPEVPDRVIAKRARCSVSAVSPVRESLRRAGRLPG